MEVPQVADIVKQKPNLRIDFYTLRLRTKLCEAADELKMKRILCAKNEAKIKNLLSELHQMENKCDEANLTIQQFQEQRQKDSDNSRKECEKFKKLNSEEKENGRLMTDALEKEVKSLKDTMQSLQLEKYDLDNQVREMSEKATLQASSRDMYIKKLEEIEEKCQSLKKECEDITGFSNELKKDVEEAVHCNQKLLKVNQHYTCVLDWRQQEAEQLKQGLPDTLKLNTQVGELQQQLFDKDKMIDVLKSQLNEQEAMVNGLTESRQQEQEKKMVALKSLENMNALWARNSRIAAKPDSCCQATQTVAENFLCLTASVWCQTDAVKFEGNEDGNCCEAVTVESGDCVQSLQCQSEASVESHPNEAEINKMPSSKVKLESQVTTAGTTNQLDIQQTNLQGNSQNSQQKCIEGEL